MFLEEVPAGLPPIRGIEYQIDLVLGASPPAAPPTPPPSASALPRPPLPLLLYSLSPCARTLVPLRLPPPSPSSTGRPITFSSLRASRRHRPTLRLLLLYPSSPCAPLPPAAFSYLRHVPRLLHPPRWLLAPPRPPPPPLLLVNVPVHGAPLHHPCATSRPISFLRASLRLSSLAPSHSLAVGCPSSFLPRSLRTWAVPTSCRARHGPTLFVLCQDGLSCQGYGPSTARAFMPCGLGL